MFHLLAIFLLKYLTTWWSLHQLTGSLFDLQLSALICAHVSVQYVNMDMNLVMYASCYHSVCRLWRWFVDFGYFVDPCIKWFGTKGSLCRDTGYAQWQASIWFTSVVSNLPGTLISRDIPVYLVDSTCIRVMYSVWGSLGLYTEESPPPKLSKISSFSQTQQYFII